MNRVTLVENYSTIEIEPWFGCDKTTAHTYINDNKYLLFFLLRRISVIVSFVPKIIMYNSIK